MSVISDDVITGSHCISFPIYSVDELFKEVLIFYDFVIDHHNNFTCGFLFYSLVVCTYVWWLKIRGKKFKLGKQ